MWLEQTSFPNSFSAFIHITLLHIFDALGAFPAAVFLFYD